MKKLISSLLFGVMLLLPLNSLYATMHSSSFFEALGNFANIEDHKLVQSFYGNAELKEFNDHISVEYRISISSVVDTGNRLDNFNRLSAYMKFINHSEVTDSTPFKEMTVQANGEVITLNQEDIYFKLNNFNIALSEPLPFAVMDIEEVMAMVDLYRGTWFHATASDLTTDELGNEMLDVEEYIALEEQLKEEPKEAVLGLSELVLRDSDSGFTDEEVNEFMEAIELALETKLFMERDVVAGRNTGFKFFNLNKGGILNLMGEVAKVFGEEMTSSDEEDIKEALSKISISGIYRIEEVFHVIDNLLLRFRLKDVEPLVQLELNYRYKLSDINKENSIKAPSEFEEWVSPYDTYDEGLFHEELPLEEIPAEEF
jgi:hypothetical protein